jgi:hypothetical protein
MVISYLMFLLAEQSASERNAHLEADLYKLGGHWDKF